MEITPHPREVCLSFSLIHDRLQSVLYRVVDNVESLNKLLAEINAHLKVSSSLAVNQLISRVKLSSCWCFSLFT